MDKVVKIGGTGGVKKGEKSTFATMVEEIFQSQHQLIPPLLPSTIERWRIFTEG